jgi:hypothetical protein
MSLRECRDGALFAAKRGQRPAPIRVRVLGKKPRCSRQKAEARNGSKDVLNFYNSIKIGFE